MGRTHLSSSPYFRNFNTSYTLASPSTTSNCLPSLMIGLTLVQKLQGTLLLLSSVVINSRKHNSRKHTSSSYRLGKLHTGQYFQNLWIQIQPKYVTQKAGCQQRHFEISDLICIPRCSGACRLISGNQEW